MFKKLIFRRKKFYPLSQTQIIIYKILFVILALITILAIVLTVIVYDSDEQDMRALLFYTFVDLNLALLAAYCVVAIVRDARFKRIEQYSTNINNDRLLRNLFTSYLNYQMLDFERDIYITKKSCYANVNRNGTCIFSITMSKYYYFNLKITETEMGYILLNSSKEFDKVKYDDWVMIDRTQYRQLKTEEFLRKIEEMYIDLSRHK